MKKFISTMDGTEFDLDNLSLYDRFPKTVKETLDRIYQEIGYAKVYIDRNFNHDWQCVKDQISRLNKFIENLAQDLNDFDLKKDLTFYHQKLFILLDEIENMC